jgi:hypothetical protein
MSYYFQSTREHELVRIPGDADHGSGLMAITIPGKPIRVPAGTRSRFRDDADQKSADRGIVIAIPGIGF